MNKLTITLTNKKIKTTLLSNFKMTRIIAINTLLHFITSKPVSIIAKEYAIRLT